MLAASILLGMLAIILAWPVPILLGRAEWPSRAPATALLLWQSIALTGVLSLLGALLTFGLQPFGDTLLRGVRGFAATIAGNRTIPGADAIYLLAIGAAILLGLHLVLNLVLTIVSTERQRRRHRQLLALLGSPDPDHPDTQLIDNAAPVAYCLPGALKSITVFSAGLVSLLTPDELGAVIEHERAHVSQRHDLLLVAFRAWHISLPWFPSADQAEREVGSLVEMLADDCARATVADATLAKAIALVAVGRPASDQMIAESPTIHAATAEQTHERVRRLAGNTLPLGPWARFGVLVVALALLAVPTILLFTPVG
jgi:Zn-dependent protease with chaperone function